MPLKVTDVDDVLWKLWCEDLPAWSRGNVRETTFVARALRENPKILRRVVSTCGGGSVLPMLSLFPKTPEAVALLRRHVGGRESNCELTQAIGLLILSEGSCPDPAQFEEAAVSMLASLRCPKDDCARVLLRTLARVGVLSRVKICQHTKELGAAVLDFMNAGDGEMAEDGSGWQRLGSMIVARAGHQR